MKILAVNQKFNTEFKSEKTHTQPSCSASLPQMIGISNICYRPNFALSFKGEWLDENIIQKVPGKKYQGAGIFNDEGSIDFSRIGSKLLAQEPLDITKKSTTHNQIYAYLYSNALRETYESPWARRYNPGNVPNPLAVFPTLVSLKSRKEMAINRDMLFDKSLDKFLNKPITDKDGKLCVDCVVFDTETTGLNTLGGNPGPLDEIVQIGALKVKNGNVVKDSAYSQYINPEREIPEGATRVHGIKNEDVKDMPTIGNVLKPFLKDYLNEENGVVVAYNSKFDVPLLNRNISEHNIGSREQLGTKEQYKVLDPFILIQKIHPYLGTKKKLGEQYKYLFCKDMENAHNAFADVEGTVDVLKYCLYYLSDHRVDKTKPLTMREVLMFQNSTNEDGKVANLDIPLDVNGCNAKVKFEKSYTIDPICVTNYFKNYCPTEFGLKGLIPEIGEANYNKVADPEVMSEIKAEIAKKPESEPEAKHEPKSPGIENHAYATRKNLAKALEIAELEPYNGKSKDEIKNLIIESSKDYIEDGVVSMWIKNTNPVDVKDGNDMADMNIARRVMSEK